MEILVLGAGIFGLTAALELGQRGHRVRLWDPGPVPHPKAASNDESRAVRFDYGGDVFWTALAEAARPGWQEWQRRWLPRVGRPVYHEDGFLFLTRDPITDDSFEGQSLRVLADRGWEVDRLDAATIRRRYPAFSRDYVDGYLNPHDGWVEAGTVVGLLAEDARAAGVKIETGRGFRRLSCRGGRVRGVETMAGEECRADLVVAALGAWTPSLLPWLGGAAGGIRCVGQAVFHLEVAVPAAWQSPGLPTWSADISRTGWYGFPAVGDQIKVANHGPGRELPADASRETTAAEEARLRAFLAAALPGLVDAPIRRRRVCVYTDTFDGAFLIDHDPDRIGLVVATGGSGHGFKFAPLLGGIIADMVEGIHHPWSDRFRWRRPRPGVADPARSPRDAGE